MNDRTVSLKGGGDGGSLNSEVSRHVKILSITAQNYLSQGSEVYIFGKIVALAFQNRYNIFIGVMSQTLEGLKYENCQNTRMFA